MTSLQANNPDEAGPDTSAGVLVLRTETPFARGGNRLCFVHPKNPDHCVKVLRPDRSPEIRRRSGRWFKRLRRPSAFDDNERERRTYEIYARHYPPSIWTHVPRCHGTVSTDYGTGIVTDLIRNADGGPAPSLMARIRDGYSKELARAIDEFRSFVREHALVTRDLLPHNFVAPLLDGGRMRLVLIDGLGCADWIPLAYYHRGFAGAKAERKLARFERKFASKCEEAGISWKP